MSATTSGKPTASAVVSGAVSGLVMFAVIVLIDHFFFDSSETARYGLMMTLLIAGVAGAVFGAVVGMVVASTRSMPAAIATGALLFAGLKLLAVGAAGGISAAAVVFGLIYGAVFGWAVASSAVKAMQEAGAA